jgi:RNA polymerase sigma-70 factor (ECF subfamily)
MIRGRKTSPQAHTARGRPGDATESQQPGGTGTGQPLPPPREAPGGAPAAPAPSFAHDYAACSDAELLKLHVDGDSDAFGELFKRHKDRLWAVAIRTLSDPEDAADALQDAMISAFRRAGSFRGESAVTTWLHRIVVNACLDRMRRRSARPEFAGGDDRLLDLIASGDPGAGHAVASETSIDVMAALRLLPHDQQVAIVLVDMLDYPVADAAEVLGVAQGTVKSRCARGRARLLPKLAHLRHSTAGQLPAAGQVPASGRGSPGGPAGTPGTVTGPARPGSVSGSDNRAVTELSVDSELETRNRFPPGSVLPAQEGGDEEE